MPVTTADKRRKQRKEELREKLQGLEYIRQIDMAVNHVIDADYQIEPNELQARKFVVDTNFKRLAKILPDLKQTELVGEDGKAIQVEMIERRIVKAND